MHCNHPQLTMQVKFHDAWLHWKWWVKMWNHVHFVPKKHLSYGLRTGCQCVVRRTSSSNMDLTPSSLEFTISILDTRLLNWAKKLYWRFEPNFYLHRSFFRGFIEIPSTRPFLKFFKATTPIQAERGFLQAANQFTRSSSYNQFNFTCKWPRLKIPFKHYE